MHNVAYLYIRPFRWTVTYSSVISVWTPGLRPMHYSGAARCYRIHASVTSCCSGNANIHRCSIISCDYRSDLRLIVGRLIILNGSSKLTHAVEPRVGSSLTGWAGDLPLINLLTVCTEPFFTAWMSFSSFDFQSISWNTDTCKHVRRTVCSKHRRGTPATSIMFLQHRYIHKSDSIAKRNLRRWMTERVTETSLCCKLKL